MSTTETGTSASALKRNRRLGAQGDGSESEGTKSPKVKKQRVSRACDQCRLSREKCDGLKPSCQTCLASKRQCTYATSPKKRGIQPGYIRALEVTLGWLFSQRIDSEQLLKQELANAGGDLHKALTGKLPTDSDAIHSHWSSSIVNKHIDQLLSNGAEAEALVYQAADTASKHLVTPAQRPSGREAEPSTRSTESTSRETISNNTRSMDGLRVDFTSSDRPLNITQLPLSHRSSGGKTNPSIHSSSVPQNRASAATVALRLPNNFWNLLDVYYTYTHSWLPISEKNDILKTVHSYPAEGLRILPGSADSGKHAELWAVIALAAVQTSSATDTETTAAMITQARSLMPLDRQGHEVGHVKALLILSIIYLGKRDWSQAWITVGNAVRIALLLDLHTLVSSKRPRNENCDPRCGHIILACFVLESIIAMYLKKPAHLTSDLISHVGPINEDGLEEWTPWEGAAPSSDRQPARTLSTFNSLVGIFGQGTDFLDKTSLSSNSIEFSSSPQLVHLKLMAAWRTVEDGSVSTRTLLDTAMRSMDRFLALGGVPAVPPTFLPLLERLAKMQDLSAYRNILLRPAVKNLCQIWSIQIPMVVDNASASTSSPLSTHLPPPSMATTISRADSSHTNDIYAESINAANTLEAMRGSQLATRFNILPPSNSPQQARLPQQPIYTDGQTHNFYPNNSLSNTLQPTPTQDASTAMASEFPIAPYNDQVTPDFFSEGGTNPDFDALFEEIAMLEGSRHAQDGAQFMQNLGVGPDLDLSTFFGADYQATDPMLAYLQPGTNNNNNNSFNGM